MSTYLVSKYFISGVLKGLMVTETTSIAWKVGQVVHKPIGNSAYKIVAVVKV